jgi:hypothetical protein
MILKYGAYAHDQDEVGIYGVDFDRILSDLREVRGERVTFMLRGTLISADHATLLTDMATLESTYSTHGQDLKLYEDDGTTPAHHELLQSGTLGDVIVKKFRWIAGTQGMWGVGAELTRIRSYEIVVEGDALDASIDILKWTERIEETGGNKKWRYIESLTGTPLAQDLVQNSTWRYVQQGMAVGRATWPTPPGPPAGWATYEHQELRKIGKTTPRYFGGTSGDQDSFMVTWEYHYSSDSALAGSPTNPP